MGVRVRAAVFVFEKDRVLLMRRIKAGREYHVVPGGGVEVGETPEEAALREIKEETNLDVKLAGKLATSNDSGGTVHYFLASEHRGELRLGGPELDRQSRDNLYFLEWIGPDELEEIDLRPENDLELIRRLVRDHIRQTSVAE